MTKTKYSEDELREIIFEEIRDEDPIAFENISDESLNQMVEERLVDMEGGE
jgi:hypothetical protein